MSRASLRRPVLAVLACCLAAAAWTASTTTANAQTTEADLTPEEFVDLLGVDLIGQTPATASSPAVIHLHVASRVANADFRARLYAPITTRAEFAGWFSDRRAGPPIAGPIASWFIDDVREIGADESGTFVSVPVRLPDGATSEGPGAVSGRWPMPLTLELVGADGSLLAGLFTFLVPAADPAAGDPAPATKVALVLDLRLPPSHLADGGAAVDEASLDRVLSLAEVLIERSDMPLSVALSPETLDALALISDDTSVAVLRTALHRRQLLTTTWTSLDLFKWTLAVRLDVVVDGLRRGAETLGWAGLEPSTVMHVEHPLAVRTVSAVTEPAVGVSAFVVDGVPAGDEPVPPVTLMADETWGDHLVAQADPLLGALMQYPDPELGAQWVLAELSRMAASGTAGAVVVSAAAASPISDVFESGPLLLPTRSPVEPAALALLLDGIEGNPSLTPVTVDDVLADQAPVGAAEPAPIDRPADSGDFDLYLARRNQVEQRLEAYESFLSGDLLLAAPLRTLLAVSASEHLTTGQRTEFLNAVDRQVALGTAGVEFLGRGPTTVTERSTDLPVTLLNNRAGPVTVALELTSDTIDLTHDEHPVFTLQPGRNDLSVPVEAASSGRTSVRVTVRTPEVPNAITLTTGTLSVRFTDAEGLGLLILIWAAATLAAWWLHTLRKRALGRSRDADSGGATVAAPGSVSGDTEN